MPDISFAVPDSVTFEQAIALTQDLMGQMEHDQLSAPQLEQAIAALVSSPNGARGFFVTYLTDDRSLADRPEAAVVAALRSAPDLVADLLVKNLAMSAAMAIAHRRQQNEAMAQGSDRVRSRSLGLMQQLQLPQITSRAQQLHDSAVTGEGADQAFLTRWGYDAEQRQEIQQALQQILP